MDDAKSTFHVYFLKRLLLSIHILHVNYPKQETLFCEKKFGIYCLL